MAEAGGESGKYGGVSHFHEIENQKYKGSAYVKQTAGMIKNSLQAALWLICFNGFGRHLREENRCRIFRRCLTKSGM